MKEITNPKPNPPRPKCVELTENFSLKHETEHEKNEAVRATSYIKDNSLGGLHKMECNNIYQTYDNNSWMSYPHKCPKCGADVRPHRVCAACGTYKGKNVINKEETAA